MNEHPAVQLRGLTRSFRSAAGTVEALRGIDLTIQKGEFVAVMGPSGAGKSTLLHLIAGLDRPTNGEVLVGAQSLAKLDEDALSLLRRRRLGIVFQAFNLIDVLEAEENVALPLLLDGVPEATAMQQARDALHLVGLASRGRHLPHQLSGGEQQRVAIARALVTNPVILLADEPTGNLDTVAGDALLTLLRQLVTEQRQTLLLVTHEARYAARADRLLRLRDGRMTEEQRLSSGAKSLAHLLGEFDPIGGSVQHEPDRQADADESAQ